MGRERGLSFGLGVVEEEGASASQGLMSCLLGLENSSHCRAHLDLLAAHDEADSASTKHVQDGADCHCPAPELPAGLVPEGGVAVGSLHLQESEWGADLRLREEQETKGCIGREGPATAGGEGKGGIAKGTGGGRSLSCRGEGG